MFGLHIRFDNEKSREGVSIVLQSKILERLTCDGQILSSSYMHEPINLVNGKVSSFKGIDSLYFPTRVGKKHFVIILFDVDTLFAFVF